MNRLIAAMLAFALLIIGISAAAVKKSSERQDPTGDYAVKLNEIENLIKQGDTDKAAERADELRQEMRAAQNTLPDRTVPVMCAVCLIFLAGAGTYYAVVIVRPFRKLAGLAEHIARGELDIPLEYERTNLFGKFTWAFDSMRSEILRARACEKEAIENNKTVTAALSHDIKTPVASIRAYAEALELGMDGDPEKRRRYIGVIMRKCDEVSKLTEDMLTHSLSELDKLQMSPEVFELNDHLEKIIRTAQIAENLISNARKYAKTPMELTAVRVGDMARITLSDHGGGIPDEDMPFVFGKFYRGRNKGTEQGSGLGLYIVRYIAEQSGGKVSLQNKNGGLQVTVSLPIADENRQHTQ